MLGEGLGIDGFGGAAVLPGQPVIAQVQVDAGGFDAGVPGLGLDRLQRHPSLPQPGQAGVAQLVTRRVRQASALPRAQHDLVEPVRRYGLLREDFHAVIDGMARLP